MRVYVGWILQPGLDIPKNISPLAGACVHPAAPTATHAQGREEEKREGKGKGKGRRKGRGKGDFVGAKKNCDRGRIGL